MAEVAEAQSLVAQRQRAVVVEQSSLVETKPGPVAVGKPGLRKPPGPKA